MPILCAGQKTTHPIVELDTDDKTVDATVPKRRVNPNCVPKPFQPDAACEKSVYDVLVLQQFEDSITTAQPTTQAVSAQKSHKESQDQGKGVKTSGFKSKWKPNRPWLELRIVVQDDHEQEGAYPKKRRVLLTILPQSSISEKRITGLKN